MKDIIKINAEIRRIENLIINGGGGGSFSTDEEHDWTALQTFQADSDLPQTGVELLTNSHFTTDLSGWTADGSWGWASGAQHTPGSSGVVNQDFDIETGKSYLVTMTVTGRTAGNVDLYFNNFMDGEIFTEENGTFYTIVSSSDTDTEQVEFYGNTDFDGTVTLVSIKEITARSEAGVFVANPDGTTGVEIRGGGSGRQNLLVGLHAGGYLVGENNVAIGEDALGSASTASNNIAIGTDALAANLITGNNVAIGGQALAALAGFDEGNNVSIGYQSSSTLTDGQNNVVIGYRAMTTANGNTSIAIGGQALEQSVGSVDNVAIGYLSLQANQGTGNTAIGAYSGYDNVAGNNNLFLSTDASGSTGNGCIFIGRFSGRSVTSNNVFELGSRVSTRLLQGVMDDDPANQVFTINAQAVNLPSIPTASASGVWNDSGVLRYGAGAVLSAYTDENAQDAVGTILTDTTTIDFTYTDATPTITADVKTDSISNTLLANMTQATIKGRADAAGTGDPTDLTATQVLTIIKTVDGSGSGLDADTLDGHDTGFFATASHTHTSGDITDFTEAAQDAIGAMIADTATIDLTYTDGTPELKADVINDSITDAKLRNAGALSVIGRSANSTGDPADISASAASGAVLRESGSTIGFGTVATAGIAANAITNAKMATMTQATIKGRADAAGTGDPTDLTATEVLTIIKTVDGSGSGLDADLLDGNSAGAFAALAVANTFTTGQTIAPSGTGTNGLLVNMPSSTTATGIVVQYNSGNYIRMLARAALTQVILDPNDFGNNVGGALLSIGRNTNASTEGPTAGCLGITQASGTARRIWPDASGDLRIHTAAPTGSSGSPTTADNAGTVIGTQTSMAEAKHIASELSSLSEVLNRVRAGAESVRRFTYKAGSYNGEEFEGVVTDYAPAYGMDRDDDHPQGKSLNEINILGDLLRMVVNLTERVERLEMQHG